MGLKDDFVQALQTLPPGIEDFLTTQIPNLPDVPFPETIEEAVIANAKCACNINTLLRTFSGVTPIEIMMRIGQLHPGIISLVLAGLQYLTPGYDVTPVFPQEGITYLTPFSTIELNVSGYDQLISLSATIQETSEEVTLIASESNPGRFVGTCADLPPEEMIPEGEEWTVNFTLQVAAEFTLRNRTQSITQTIHFTVGTSGETGGGGESGGSGSSGEW